MAVLLVLTRVKLQSRDLIWRGACSTIIIFIKGDCVTRNRCLFGTVKIKKNNNTTK